MVNTQQVLAVIVIPGVTRISSVGYVPRTWPPKRRGANTCSPSSIYTRFGISLTKVSGIGMLALLSESPAL